MVRPSRHVSWIPGPKWRFSVYFAIYLPRLIFLKGNDGIKGKDGKPGSKGPEVCDFRFFSSRFTLVGQINLKAIFCLSSSIKYPNN